MTRLPRRASLHLLVREVLECAAGAALTGRLSPAWVFLEQDRVRVQAFVRSVRPRGSCDDIRPTPITVTLPEAHGRRDLEDVMNDDLCLGAGASGPSRSPSP